jgi:hypothetical protein
MSRRISLDEAAFSTVTQESAYWIGFLLADGGIAKSRPLLCLSLAAVDEGHVKKFRCFLKSGHALIRVAAKSYPNQNNGPTVRLSVQSNAIITDLARFGVVPQKSAIAHLGNGLEADRHAWRGIIDGDGHIGEIKRPYGQYPLIGLCGSRRLLEQFQIFVRNIHYCRATVHQTKSAGLCETKISGRAATAVLKILYEDCSIALDRKRATAMRLIEKSKTYRYRATWRGRQRFT